MKSWWVGWVKTALFEMFPIPVVSESGCQSGHPPKPPKPPKPKWRMLADRNNFTTEDDEAWCSEDDDLCVGPCEFPEDEEDTEEDPSDTPTQTQSQVRRYSPNDSSCSNLSFRCVLCEPLKKNRASRSPETRMGCCAWHNTHRKALYCLRNHTDQISNQGNGVRSATLLGNEEKPVLSPFFHTRCFAWPTRIQPLSGIITRDRPSWLLWPPKWTEEVWMITGGIQASLSMGIVWLVGMLKLNDANIRDATLFSRRRI